MYISADNDNAFAGDDSSGINSIGELLKQSQLRFTNWANQATLLLMKTSVAIALLYGSSCFSKEKNYIAKNRINYKCQKTKRNNFNSSFGI